MMQPQTPHPGSLQELCGEVQSEKPGYGAHAQGSGCGCAPAVGVVLQRMRNCEVGARAPVCARGGRGAAPRPHSSRAGRGVRRGCPSQNRGFNEQQHQRG